MAGKPEWRADATIIRREREITNAMIRHIPCDLKLL